LQVIIFQEQIFERLSLGAKERIIGADKTYKYPYPVTYQSMTPKTTRGINSHQRLLLSICTLPT